MPRETPKNHYRRSYDFINTKLYVIATEGYNTEYTYFTAFKKKFYVAQRNNMENHLQNQQNKCCKSFLNLCDSYA